MEKLGLDALERSVTELERENAQLRSYSAELLARVQKLEHEAQTMHDLIWETARSGSRPPPTPPDDSDGRGDNE